MFQDADNSLASLPAKAEDEIVTWPSRCDFCVLVTTGDTSSTAVEHTRVKDSLRNSGPKLIWSVLMLPTSNSLENERFDGNGPSLLRARNI